jgi:TRAP-type C4-dicarboxylate transport system permease small subunit
MTASRWTALRTLWQRSMRLLCAALFAVLFGAFVIQIFTRYVLNDPVTWSQELCSLAYLWVVCIASATLVSERQHIAFDMIYHHVAPRRRRILAILSTGLIVLLFAAGLPGTVDYIMFMGRIRTLDLRIPFDIVYSCFVLFMVLSIIFGLVRLRRLFGADWEQEL